MEIVLQDRITIGEVVGDWQGILLIMIKKLLARSCERKRSHLFLNSASIPSDRVINSIKLQNMLEWSVT